MEKGTKKIARDLLVIAKSVIGGAIKGWVDPHGKYFKVPGNLIHEDIARDYLVRKGEIDDGNDPYWGSDKLFKMGWFRVVSYGSDSLAAVSQYSSGQSLHTLTPPQIKTLSDMAIEYGLTSILQENGSKLITVWSDDSLGMVAKSRIAFEFPSKDALDKYLKDHPKAKSENHWVKNQKSDKKTDDAPVQKVQKKVEKPESKEKTIDIDPEEALGKLDDEIGKAKCLRDITGKGTGLLFHGTIKERKIDKFDLSKGDWGVGSDAAAQGKDGIYLTDDVQAARYFSRKAGEFYELHDEKKRNKKDKDGKLDAQGISDAAWDRLFGPDDGNIIATKLAPDAKIKDFKGYPSKEDVKKAKEEGFDGIRFREQGMDGVEDYPDRHLGPSAFKSNTTFVFNLDKIQVVKNNLSLDKGKRNAKPEAKPSQFELPENKALKYETPGNLGDIHKWKAKIILGNSMGDDKKVGDMDKVGYVGINTRTNEIVPIARADEHQAGHELLYHLAEKGMIKGSPKDFVTLYPTTNYPHYSSNNSHQYVEAIKKWLAYGGPNVVVHSVAVPKDGWTSGREKEYVTDMEEYAQKNGDVDYGQKGPTKPAKELLDSMEGAIEGVKKGDQKAFEEAATAANRIRTFDTNTIKKFDDADMFDKEIKEASDEKDLGKLGKTLGKMAKALQEAFKEEAGNKYSKNPSFYGTGPDSRKRIEKMAGESVKSEGGKGEEKLTSGGQGVIEKFEKAANAVSKELTMPGTMGPGFDRMSDAAEGLVKDLQPMVGDVDGLGAALERLHRAVDKQDGDELQQALFSYNGVKNLLHNRLRKMEKDGVVKDKNFGDVKTALSEFDRLGQI